MSVNPSRSRPASLRSDGAMLVCTHPRRRSPLLPCDSIICRPSGRTLVIRCKNCKNDHVFGIRNGYITPLDADDPEAVRAQRPTVAPVLPSNVR